MNQVSLVTLLFLALRGDIRESGTGFGKLAFLESSGRKPIRAQKEKDYCPELSHFGVKLKSIVTYFDMVYRLAREEKEVLRICNPVSVLVQAVTLRDSNHQGSGLKEISEKNPPHPDPH